MHEKHDEHKEIGTPLVKKLGIKPGYQIYVHNPPEHYQALVSPLPAGVMFTPGLSANTDMIHFFTKSKAELASHIKSLLENIKPDGMIWVSWPKKASRVPTDMSEDFIRQVALPLGLVDVKVAAVDEIWSGLKLVIRVENRRKPLRITILPAGELPPSLWANILVLCNRAYGKELEPLFANFQDAVHVLAFQEERLGAHAMWVTRRLQPANGPFLNTAYVEMVATAPEFQGRGLGRAVMRALAGAIAAYDLGALCPADTRLYEHLGWEYWRGPLFIRGKSGMIPTPGERVMILRLPNTPPLNMDEPLSAEWREGELW